MRQPAVGDALHHTLLPPRLEILRLRHRPRVLDPLDHLGHRHEVDVIVVGQDFINPEQERIQKLRIVLQPSRVEVETQRRPVLLVVAVEVVGQEVVELIPGEDVGTRVDHGASREVLVVVRVFSSVEFVEHHFPHCVAPGWAGLEISMAAVWHAEVHGVRPEGRITQGRSDCRVIQERLFLHHGELVVPTHAEIRSSHTHDAIVSQIGEFLDYDPHSRHFFGPIVHSSVRPELFIAVMPVVMETT